MGEHISDSGLKTFPALFDMKQEEGFASRVLELKWWGIVACSLFPTMWDKPVYQKRAWSPHREIGIGKMADEWAMEIAALFPLWVQLCLKSPPSLKLLACKSVTHIGLNSVTFCCRKGDPFQGLRVGCCFNTRKWIVLGDTRADKARDFTSKGCPGGELEGREPRRSSLPHGPQSRVLWGWDQSLRVISHHHYDRVLSGGLCITKPKWIPAGRIPGGW